MWPLNECLCCLWSTLGRSCMETSWQTYLLFAIEKQKCLNYDGIGKMSVEECNRSFCSDKNFVSMFWEVTFLNVLIDEILWKVKEWCFHWQIIKGESNLIKHHNCFNYELCQLKISGYFNTISTLWEIILSWYPRQYGCNADTNKIE